jgi:uncharacterized protein (DUF362 family)
VFVTSKVAVVELNGNVQRSFSQAFKLIGNIGDLNSTKKPVVIKLGVFDHKKEEHTTVSVVNAIINNFNKAPRIFLAESDNYKGKGSERLQIWKQLFDDRVVPFNLSDDLNTKEVSIADEKIGLSHILFKPNVFVSTHALRRSEQGTVLKNLLGLIPDRKKMRFHKRLSNALMDLYQAVGGIDLAVLDGTYTYSSLLPSSANKRVNTNILLVGKDAVAVESVGAALVGLNPNEIPVIKEALNRDLGEANLRRIEVLGSSIESFHKAHPQLLKSSKKKVKHHQMREGNQAFQTKRNKPIS